MSDNVPEVASSLANNLNTLQRQTPIAIRQVSESPADPQIPSTPPPNLHTNLTLGAEAMERSRHFVNNISTTIEEIQPYLEQVRTRTGISWSWLNSRRQNNTERIPPVLENQPENTFVINMDDSQELEPTNAPQNSPIDHSHQHNTTSTDNYLNNIREAANAENPNNNNDDDEVRSSLSPEAMEMMKILSIYIPFLLILIIKFIYDYKGRIFHIAFLFSISIQADSYLKTEISKQQNRRYLALLGILLYVSCCIVLVFSVFDQPMLLQFVEPTSAWELFWLVTITDLMLKLITIIVKILFSCLPARIIALQNRGKYYLMLEATSQVCRSIAPIQAWCYYLFESYQGVEKLFGIFLIIAYIVSKGDLLSRVKLFEQAAVKLTQQVSFGSFATKSQLADSGGICSICHEEFTTPVKLHCDHIFCELCVITWLDRKSSCPLCRAPISDNPIYRDGHTSNFIQLF